MAERSVATEQLARATIAVLVRPEHAVIVLLSWWFSHFRRRRRRRLALVNGNGRALAELSPDAAEAVAADRPGHVSAAGDH